MFAHQPFVTSLQVVNMDPTVQSVLWRQPNWTLAIAVREVCCIGYELISFRLSCHSCLMISRTHGFLGNTVFRDSQGRSLKSGNSVET